MGNTQVTRIAQSTLKAVKSFNNKAKFVSSKKNVEKRLSYDVQASVDIEYPASTNGIEAYKI